MIQRHIDLREDQDLALRKIPGSVAEHIRRAIDLYLKELQKGISPSKGNNELL